MIPFHYSPAQRQAEPRTDADILTDALESSVSLDVMIAITAGRVEALADMIHGREPNEERAFARSTCREVYRPVFGLAFREQLGLSGMVLP